MRKALEREGNCSDDDKHPSQLQTKNKKQKDSDDLIQTGNEHIGDEKWSWAQKNAETRLDWHTSKALHMTVFHCNLDIRGHSQTTFTRRGR